MDFTAIDFETANYQKTSACSIGLARVENGRITSTDHYYIRPHPNYFTAANIAVHGILARDVEDAPTFAELWPQIREQLDGQIVAAHWATFDMGVLTALFDHYGIPYPEMDILCSCLMARSAFPQLANHKLNNVCNYLDIPLDHHRADSDAEGSASIILQVSKDRGILTLDDVREQLGVVPGSIRRGVYTSVKGPGGRRRRC